MDGEAVRARQIVCIASSIRDYNRLSDRKGGERVIMYRMCDHPSLRRRLRRPIDIANFALSTLGPAGAEPKLPALK